MTSELNEGNNWPAIINSNLKISGVRLVKTETYSDALDYQLYPNTSHIHPHMCG